jgi:hypothetical protein
MQNPTARGRVFCMGGGLRGVEPKGSVGADRSEAEGAPHRNLPLRSTAYIQIRISIFPSPPPCKTLTARGRVLHGGGEALL